MQGISPQQQEPPSIITALQLQDFLLVTCGLLVIALLFTLKAKGKIEEQVTELTGQLAAAQQVIAAKKCPACPACPPVVKCPEQRPCPACPEVAKGGHDQPPIITLAETERKYSFDPGSAVLSVEFKTALARDIVPQIVQAQGKYGVNMIQVIGHTDETPLGSRAGNLDQTLVGLLWGVAHALSGSNVDLAMVRAIEVLKALREDQRLVRFNMVPYSAGQVLMPGDILSTGEKVPNPSRRRVVIRLTRS